MSWRIAAGVGVGMGETGLGAHEEDEDDEDEAGHSAGFMSWRLRQNAVTCSVLWMESAQIREKERECHLRMADDP